MKVIYTGATDEHVRWGYCADPRDRLIEGRQYEVSRTQTFAWHTKLYLTEFPGEGFNSVSFEPAAQMQEVKP